MSKVAKQKRKKHVRYAPQQLKKEYDDLRPRLDRLAAEIDHQVKELFASTVALAFPIQHRVKLWDSIAEKLERVPLSITHIGGLQDLVGFRMVLQFRRDVDMVCSQIEKTFDVLSRYDTVERLKEDQFGYSSVHFVVQLPTEWLAVPTMKDLAGLKAEMQVRTTAQHIWAEASRVLQYKNERAVPLTLRRSIYRVSALLETVDLEFERVLADRDKYRATLETSAPVSSEELNVETLQRILRDSWPASNKGDGEDFGNLLTELQEFKITTPKHLKALISKWHDTVLKTDAGIVKEHLNNPDQPRFEDETERLKAGVFYTHAGLTREALTLEFGQRYRDFQTAFYSSLIKASKNKSPQRESSSSDEPSFKRDGEA